MSNGIFKFVQINMKHLLYRLTTGMLHVIKQDKKFGSVVNKIQLAIMPQFREDISHRHQILIKPFNADFLHKNFI